MQHNEPKANLSSEQDDTAEKAETSEANVSPEQDDAAEKAEPSEKTDFHEISEFVIAKVRLDIKKGFTQLVLDKNNNNNNRKENEAVTPIIQALPEAKPGGSAKKIASKKMENADVVQETPSKEKVGGKRDRKMVTPDDLKVKKAVEDVRDTTALSENEKLCSVDPDAHLAKFEKTLAKIRKYSMGNCSEYACIVLDEIWQYAQQHHIEIFAERMKISKGDHNFVVINRKRPSDINDPTTWGDDAIICDAWSGDTYSAKEYAEKLRNYGYLGPRTIATPMTGLSISIVVHELPPEHFTEPFNTKMHGFQLLYANTDTLNQRKDPQYLAAMNDLYQYKIEVCKNELETYKDRLQKVTEYLHNKYGDAHKKSHMVSQKILALQSLLADLQRSDFSWCSTINTYEEKHVLEEKLRQLFKIINTNAYFTPEEVTVLTEYDNVENPKAYFFKFFNRETEELSSVKKAIDLLREGIKTKFAAPPEKARDVAILTTTTAQRG